MPSAYEQGNPGGSHAGWFSTTHWSVVRAASHGSGPGAREALEQLCRTYWLPLYVYVRRQGYGAEDSQDLTQAFFAHLLQKNYLGRANPERGRFRTFLLTSFQNFLRHEWERGRAAKRGGGHRFISWDEATAEGRYRVEKSSELTPDQIFDQRWAMVLFGNALSRLQRESSAAGKSAQFDELQGFLGAEPGGGAYAGVAARLGLSLGAVAQAVHRLRQRYREIVREEVAHTVATPEDAEQELHHLIKLIRA